MPAHTHRIVVVGGGFTAAAYIILAVRLMPGPLTFEVIDPAEELGRGVAYSTKDPLHRINVPSDRMSLFPEDVDHATRWLFEHGVLPGDRSSEDGSGRYYVPRWHYGSYVHDVLRRTIRDLRDRVRLRHRRAYATDVVGEDGQWTVRLSNGALVDAMQLVVCVGHASPILPFPLRPDAVAHPGLIANPWHAAALAKVDRDANVLLIGTELTMADMVETLLGRGHRGRITAISRRALLPLPQGQFRTDFDFLQGEALPNTAVALLRLARKRAEQTELEGAGWQVAADALRFDLPELWQALPAGEKTAVARRLLAFWEVHRFRMAPQPYSTLRDGIQSDRIVVEKGSVLGLEAAGSSLRASILKKGQQIEKEFDAVAVCVGPDRSLSRNPIIRQLISKGIASPDILGTGLAVDRTSRLISKGGRVHQTAMALGPITRGTFGEMTGAPDIILHLRKVVTAPGSGPPIPHHRRLLSS